MSIVVTGATGKLGHLVVEELLDRGVPADQVVAGGRALEKVEDLAARGVRTARVDLDEPETLTAVLSEGDTLVLVSGTDVQKRVQQHRDAIAAAAGAGVGHLVYTSAPHADDTSLVLAPDHAATERAVRESGVPFTIVRNNWYTENYVQAFEQAKATGEVVASAGAGRVASATRRDYAAAIAAVVTSDGHAGTTYELSGDVAWSFDDLADAFAEVAGRDVAYRSVTADEHVAILTEVGLDEATARFVAALDGNIREGALADATGDLARLAGRPSTPLVEAVRGFAA